MSPTIFCCLQLCCWSPVAWLSYQLSMVWFCGKEGRVHCCYLYLMKFVNQENTTLIFNPSEYLSAACPSDIKHYIYFIFAESPGEGWAQPFIGSRCTHTLNEDKHGNELGKDRAERKANKREKEGSCAPPRAARPEHQCPFYFMASQPESLEPSRVLGHVRSPRSYLCIICLLYTSDAADE